MATSHHHYYLCGYVGTGLSSLDQVRPEIADEGVSFGASFGQPWPSNQCVVYCPHITEERHAELAYHPTLNPDGYDWWVLDDAGEVIEYGAA